MALFIVLVNFDENLLFVQTLRMEVFKGTKNDHSYFPSCRCSKKLVTSNMSQIMSLPLASIAGVDMK